MVEDVALVINAQQVALVDPVEVDTEGVYPECLRLDWILSTSATAHNEMKLEVRLTLTVIWPATPSLSP